MTEIDLKHPQVAAVLDHAFHMARVRPEGPDRDVAIVLLRIVGRDDLIRSAEAERIRLREAHKRVFGEKDKG